MKLFKKVYFIPVNQRDDQRTVKQKLTRLVKESRLLDCVHRADKLAIKIHFGEEQNTGFVKPEYVRVIHDAITARQATSFLSDTNTLYRGRRMNSSDHLKLAYEHGFTPEIVGAEVLIPDDTKKENVSRVTINQRFIKVASIAKLFLQADGIIGLAHFKGHMMTGFGGALKNIGMGCATREGKLAQHSDISPIIFGGRCVGCAACGEICPVKAISIKGEKAYLDSSKCIGCASCIAACTHKAIDVDWESGGDNIQEKMVEYTQAALKGKEKKCVFLNFATKITKECDCLAKDDPRIAPDIGILASADPVSLDQATLDLVNQACGRDIFKKVHPDRDSSQQLEYAARLGIGNLDYEIIKL